MLEQTIRFPFEQLFVEPFVRWLGHRVTPLQITWLAGVFGVLFIPFLLLGFPIIAIILLLISGYCDILDGALARYQDNATVLGSVMDITIDRLVEFSVIFGLYLLNPVVRGLTTVLMLGSILFCITSFLVVGIFTANSSHKSFHYSPGLMERAEAFGFFIIMVLLPNYFNFIAFLFTFLVCFTAVIRLKQFAKYNS